MIVIYITFPDKKEAQSVSRVLLEKKLIACSNIYSFDSSYWWKNQIKTKQEFAMIAKTTQEKYESVKQEVERSHSYDIPCITYWKANANKKYIDWMKRCVNEGSFD
ncbi:MAG: Divalent-cation tolerance protein CutA [Candidatus Woesearchaeota archaeon]|nr:Divalent-cation tolerance protein CutA [Candidatus Woesearchaeota archaeon]